MENPSIFYSDIAQLQADKWPGLHAEGIAMELAKFCRNYTSGVDLDIDQGMLFAVLKNASAVLLASIQQEDAQLVSLLTERSIAIISVDLLEWKPATSLICGLTELFTSSSASEESQALARLAALHALASVMADDEHADKFTEAQVNLLLHSVDVSSQISKGLRQTGSLRLARAAGRALEECLRGGIIVPYDLDKVCGEDSHQPSILLGLLEGCLASCDKDRRAVAASCLRVMLQQCRPVASTATTAPSMRHPLMLRALTMGLQRPMFRLDPCTAAATLKPSASLTIPSFQNSELCSVLIKASELLLAPFLTSLSSVIVASLDSNLCKKGSVWYAFIYLNPLFGDMMEQILLHIRYSHEPEVSERGRKCS